MDGGLHRADAPEAACSRSLQSFSSLLEGVRCNVVPPVKTFPLLHNAADAVVRLGIDSDLRK